MSLEDKIDQEFCVYPDIVNEKRLINNKYRTMDFYRSLSDCEKIIIHCTATDSEAWDNPMACINYDLQPNHISKKGCPFATYHFYVNKKGGIYQLVSLNLYTWNVAGHNRDSIAICINHGATKDNVYNVQYEALIDAIVYVFDLMDWSYSEDNVRERVTFHRDFNPAKSCPGKLNKEQLQNNVIARLKTYGDFV